MVNTGLARSQRDIAARLRVAPSLVVSLVDQLIEAGAVTRSRSTSDRRVQLIGLTERGRELLEASARAAEEVDADFRASLSPAGRAALDSLLLDLDTRHPAVIAESRFRNVTPVWRATRAPASMTWPIIPCTGHWLVQNSPANRVPSHGTHAFATTYAIDFVPVTDSTKA